MDYSLGNIWLFLQVLILVKAEEMLHTGGDKDRTDNTIVRRESQQKYDREGWEAVTNEDMSREDVFYDDNEDYDAHHIISDRFSDYFIKSPKDKFDKYRVRSDYQSTNKFNKDHALHKQLPSEDYDYDYDYQPVSRPVYTPTQWLRQDPDTYQPKSGNNYKPKQYRSQKYDISPPHRQFLESGHSDNHNIAPSVDYEHDQPSEQVTSQAPGIILFLIDLLDSVLESRKTKIHTRDGNVSNLNLGNRVTIDTVTAIQEVMLKFLEFGAFVATDLLFQLFWPV